MAASLTAPLQGLAANQQFEALRDQAEAEKDLGQLQAGQARKAARARLARNRARFGAAGVDLGSTTAVDVLAEQAAQGELVARNLEQAGKNRQNLLKFQADQVIAQMITSSVGAFASEAVTLGTRGVGVQPGQTTIGSPTGTGDFNAGKTSLRAGVDFRPGAPGQPF